MLETFKQEIEKQLHLALEDKALEHSPELKAAVHYSVFPTGKCLRPLLACALAQDLGADGLALAPIAASLELIHVSTLIHDDLPEMDNDDERRGRPSTHKKFGHATALLAGNYLAGRGIEWVGEQHEVEPIQKSDHLQVLVRALCSVNIGQQRDLLSSRLFDFETQALKTGSLFSAAYELAAQWAQCPLQTCRIFAQVGEFYGQVFQLRDDVDDGKIDINHGEECNEASAYFSKCMNSIFEQCAMSEAASLGILRNMAEVIMSKVLEITSSRNDALYEKLRTSKPGNNHPLLTESIILEY